MHPIDLHVELDIMSFTYSILGPHALGPPHLFFYVELDRPTKWAGNGGESFLSLFPWCLSHTSSSDRTWQGVIGVRLDTNPPWSSELHKEMVDSLCSCFEGRDETRTVLWVIDTWSLLVFTCTLLSRNELAAGIWTRIGKPVPTEWLVLTLNNCEILLTFVNSEESINLSLSMTWIKRQCQPFPQENGSMVVLSSQEYGVWFSLDSICTCPHHIYKWLVYLGAVQGSSWSPYCPRVQHFSVHKTCVSRICTFLLSDPDNSPEKAL